MTEVAVAIEPSSGNVFADLGLPDPEERLLKAELGRQIRTLIGARGLTQTDAAELLGLHQPHVSNLVRGKLAGFSVERLMGYLNLLGQDVVVIVTPAPDQTRGHITVTGASIDPTERTALAGHR